METVAYIKLSQLTNKISSAIKDTFASRKFWVIADISNHAHYPDKHSHYFDLVEKEEDTDGIVAKIGCSAWRNGAMRIKAFEEATGQQFKTGINALVQVIVEYHCTYGLRLTLFDIDPSFTIGMLEQQKQDILQKLLVNCSSFISKKDGLFITKNNQLQLHPVIQKIAVVSSSNSAGLQDFVHTLTTNSFDYKFALDYYYTTVQGEANAELVHNRFIDIFHSKVPYDAVVLIRGGGAQTDFLIFDQFILGKVVAKFPIPVITGIGHLKNETIVDLMAHSPTKTPTKAAEFIVAHNRNFEEAIQTAQKTIVIKAQQCIAKKLQLLSGLNLQLISHTKNATASINDKLSFIHQNITYKTKQVLYEKKAGLQAASCKISSLPAAALTRLSYQLSCTSTGIQSHTKMHFMKQKSYLEQFHAVARLMDPVNIVKRGFAMVYYKDRITPSGKDIPVGAEVMIQLPDTKMTATVTAKNNIDGDADV